MKRDLLWEACCLEMYGEPTPALTAPERGKLNKQLKHLRSIEATPELLREKCKLYRKLHPSWEFTIPAVVAHWNSLKIPVKRTETHYIPPRELSNEEREKGREVARSMLPKHLAARIRG